MRVDRQNNQAEGNADSLTATREPSPSSGLRTVEFRRFGAAALVLTMAASLCGCTSFSDYIHNGFKVGPNYCKPAAPVAKTWIDADDARVKTNEVDLSRWWAVFNDPAPMR